MKQTTASVILFLFISLLTNNDSIHAMKPYQEQIIQAKKAELISSCLYKLCNKSFATMSELNTHMKIHRPYLCNLCNQRFASTANLISHQRTHTGERPYLCNLCDQRFASTSNLKR